MPNEFEFKFSREAMQTLMVDGVTEIVVSAKVVYDQKSQTSTFEISAQGVGTPDSEQSMLTQTMPASIPGCPKPC